MTCTIVTNGEELYLKCKNEHEKPCLTIKAKLLHTVWSLYCEGYDVFYLNCEYGIPLWAAEIICALKMYNPVKLNIVTPYEEQSVNWCEEYRERYFKVHFHADSVHMTKKQFSNECYNKADCYMIDRSDMLFVFGRNNLHSMGYARSQGVDIRRYADFL